MANEDLATVFVLLCDWRGHIVWSSRPADLPNLGEFSWAGLAPESQEKAREMHAKVATLRETRTMTVVNLDGRHFRCWLWPLDTPEIAVCALCREVPGALHELSERELECLQLLAQGLPTRDIAEQLDFSTSTLHTHLTRSRQKLGLENLESLISFAARYCYPATRPLLPEKRA